MITRVTPHGVLFQPSIFRNSGNRDLRYAAHSEHQTEPAPLSLVKLRLSTSTAISFSFSMAVHKNRCVDPWSRTHITTTTYDGPSNDTIVETDTSACSLKLSSVFALFVHDATKPCL